MKSKKIIILIVSIIICVTLIGGGIYLSKKNNKPAPEIKKLKELPKPEITGGTRGELGIDKNINEETIDEYLNRDDSVYRDMRMLEDPGNYESIGGDKYLSGYVKGFEVIPLPYIIPVTGLPSEVGDTYTGTTLFYDDNGTYVANYKESMEIIEKIFPKDKVIFLMCGGGGYAGMTKNFLVSLGWNPDKIYNVGGYWYYNGKNNVEVKKTVDGKVVYDFDSVPYHKIEFEKLTKTDKYKEPTVKVTELKINTSQLTLEEGASFKLNVIVLPNEATNKQLKWTSSDDAVATVTNDGLVKAVKQGKATITISSLDNNKTVTCEIIVNKKEVSNKITMDNLSKEMKEFSSYDIGAIIKKYNDILDVKDDSNGNLIPNKYHDCDGNGCKLNDLGKELYEKQDQELSYTQEKRLEIFNKLITNKKSFIVIIEDTSCQDTYDVSGQTKKILEKNNYSYFVVSTTAGSGNGDKTFFESKLDISNYKGGALAIVKDGKLYASSNPNVDAIKSKEDIINWLSKYIEIK